MIDRIENILRRLADAMVVIVGVSLILMMVNVVADVAGKFFLKRPVPGTSEIVANYYMIAVVFLPLPIIELKNKAIYVDLFFTNFPRWARRGTLCFAYFLQIVFFGALTWQSFWDSIESYIKGEMVEGLVNIIIWPAQFFLPLGFGMAVAVTVLRLVQTLVDSAAIGAIVDPNQHHFSMDDL